MTGAVSAAPVIEIFHSVQGEGRYAGRATTFVRTAKCPIRCRYCDTPNSYRATDVASVRGADEACEVANPLEAVHALELAESVTGPGPRLLSITGGEPLVHPEFVATLGRHARERGFLVHLETAALDPDALARCLEHVDHVSADYKLASTLQRGDHAASHLECVRRAVDAQRTVDVKLVVLADTPSEEIDRALSALAPHRDSILLIVQPVTPFGEVTEVPDAAAVLAIAGQAAGMGFDVRVLPQLHKTLGVD